MDFTNKRVVITGAAVGIGRDIAIAFSKAGAHVAINYSKSSSDAEKTIDLVKNNGVNGIAVRCDVSQADSVKQFFDEAVTRLGGVDILVNNAGVTSFIPFSDLESADDDTWLKLYKVNVMGSFFCAREAATAMGDYGGAIVNISSIAGHRTSASSIPYAVSKAAVLHLTRCLAVTLGPKIRVNSISPGTIEGTRWNSAQSQDNNDLEALYSKAASESILKQVGSTSDIVSAVLFMSGNDSSFCSGVDLLVDGGRYLTV